MMRRWLIGGLATLALLAGTGVVLDRLFPPGLARLAVHGTVVRDRRGRVLAMLPAPGVMWQFPVRVRAVSPLLVRMLVAVEDRSFYFNPGVNPLAILRAAAQDAAAGRVVSGASTLTMQVARLLHPRPRTLRAKIIEALRAVQLTAHFSKRRILSMWLTLAPFGGNLVGAEAAARAWFGTSAAALSPAQAALLVALPRRPEALRPDLHPRQARIVRDRILRLAARRGLISRADLAQALATPVPTARRPMPRMAPQVVATLAGPAHVPTTLDAPLQAALQVLARRQLQGLPPHASLAIVVADARRRAIRALVAGDWGDAERAGYMDLTRAIRSPGSALKPFLYGLAFEDGLAGPQTLLNDLPTRFGGYAPEDFNHRFRGRVSAASALRRSLNLPAVELMGAYGPLRFVAALGAAGVRLHLPSGAAPSLPVVLGGAGTSLRDMAALYAALATDGVVAPLRLRRDEGRAGHRLLSAEAARTVAAILTRRFPGGGPDGIAWKTGTSWGNRDSWAFGFDRRHVVGVWVGRPDGTAMPGATGTGTALPIVAEVFGLLPASPRAAPKPPPRLVFTTARPADPLRLLFPPAGATLAAHGPIRLRAMGGQRPLRFLIDGRPIPSRAALRDASWRPPGPGFYRITVLDQSGAARDARVRVER